MSWRGYLQSASWVDEDRKPTGRLTIWYTEDTDITVAASQVNYRIATIIRSDPPVVKVRGEEEIVYRLGDVFFVIGDYQREDGSVGSLVCKPMNYFCYRAEDDNRLIMTFQEITFHQEATREALAIHPFSGVLSEIYSGKQGPSSYYRHLLHRNGRPPY
jgi:hypothetical protein